MDYYDRLLGFVGNSEPTAEEALELARLALTSESLSAETLIADLIVATLPDGHPALLLEEDFLDVAYDYADELAEPVAAGGTEAAVSWVEDLLIRVDGGPHTVLSNLFNLAHWPPRLRGDLLEAIKATVTD